MLFSAVQWATDSGSCIKIYEKKINPLGIFHLKHATTITIQFIVEIDVLMNIFSINID